MSLSWSSSVTSPVAISRMPALSRPRSANCFMNAAPWPEGRNTNSACGLRVAHLLQHRREVRRAQRRAQLVDHLAAVERDAVDEVLLGVDAGAVVADQRDDLLDAVLVRPLGDRHRRLRQREAGAHDEGRGLGDGRGGRGHHDHRRLGLRGDRRGGHRRGRDAEAGQRDDLVVDDQFLRQAARLVGRAGVVLQRRSRPCGRRSPGCSAPCRA